MSAAGEAASLFAQVILDIPSRALSQPFSYLVPESLANRVAVGCAVLVDFNGRPALGYVTEVSGVAAADLASGDLKPVREILSEPLFGQRQVLLATWIAREYLCPLSEAIRLFTPPGSSWRLVREQPGQYSLKPPEAGAVSDQWVRLTEAGQSAAIRPNAVRQRAIIDILQASEMKVSELALTVQNAAASLKSLQKYGYVLIENRRRLRGQARPLPPTNDITTLTAGQRNALDSIIATLEALDGLGTASRAGLAPTPGTAATPGPASPAATASPPGPATSPTLAPTTDPGFSPKNTILLDGITGSGKTEIYLQAIRFVLERGGTAIVLVPEISLTPQTVARFRSRFGEQVAVLHSRLSVGERYDQWDMLRTGSARVAIGARSALFAPVENLKLIIIDEEHEASYKQGSAPRYSSRDVAMRLAQISNAALILGSATPSIESLAAVSRGQMQHLRLTERPNGRPLPPIQIVDLTSEFKEGNLSMFSTALAAALQQVMAERQKAVLLLNRRGYASFLLCRDCGYVPMCESCSTSLTFHEHPPQLVCHHCGAKHAVPARCPACDSPYLRQLSPGTQFAHDQLRLLLGEDTPVVRMDADSTRGKYGHEQRLEEFAAAEYGVLLGTQMIAKGLDFAEVTLVGVLIADTALKLPDFRAAERTWQLLEQVSGRAGRAERDGRVIVQTYWPEHLAIQAAAQHRRNLLLVEEARLRSEFFYPPYARLANIIISSEDLTSVQKAADRLAAKMNADLPPGYKLLGPSPCVISRRQKQHRWHILVKSPLASDLPGWLASVMGSGRSLAGVTLAIDVDPYDLM